MIHLNGKNFGPLSSEEIFEFLNKKQIDLYHYAYDRELSLWKMLGEFTEFISFIPFPPPFGIEKRTYFLYSKSKVHGPLSKAEVLSELQQQSLSLFDFIQKEEEKQWVRLKDHRDFMNVIPKAPIEVPDFSKEPVNNSENEKESSTEGDGEAEADNGDKNFSEIDSVAISKKTLEEDDQDPEQSSGEKSLTQKSLTQKSLIELFNQSHIEIKNNPIWMIKKGDKSLGPYRYLEILRMIQKKVITNDNLIRKKKDEEWVKLIGVREFNPKIIRKLTVDKDEKKLEKMFIMRRFKRSSFLGAATISFGGKIFSGTCSSISEGGAFIEMRLGEFKKGDLVHVKIIPGAVTLSLECNAKVVAINERAPKGIGVKFIQLDDNVMKKVREFVFQYANIREEEE